jgi:hypothetical protein
VLKYVRVNAVQSQAHHPAAERLEPSSKHKSLSGAARKKALSKKSLNQYQTAWKTAKVA